MNDRLLHTPEGVRDIHWVETAQKNEMQKRILSVFNSYGFKGVQTPTFEYIDVFNHERGTVDIQLMYKFFDRDGNILALRPDITPSIARLVATSFEKDLTPKRISYLGNTFRNNESYQGKLREFTQAGVELINADSVESDAEVLAVVVASLLACGLEEFQIDVGQASFFLGLVEQAGISKDHEEELRRLIDEKNYIALENSLNSLNIGVEHKEALLTLPKLFGSIDVVEKAKAITNNPKALQALDRLEEIYSLLKDYGIEQYITVDLGMVSQINYYTGIVFRGYTYGTGVSIVDGGRYDSLLGQFGQETPAVGFAIIIDELLSSLSRQKIDIPVQRVDTLLVYQKSARKIALKISENMRLQGMIVENGLVNQSLEDNIAYGKTHQIGGILHFISEDLVEMINLSTDERNSIAVSELLDETMEGQTP